MTAARYWRWLFLVDLVCASAAAALLGTKYSLGPLDTTFLAALFTLLLVPALAVGVSFAAARFYRLSRPERRPPLELVRAWIIETVAFERAVLAMMIEPWRASGRDSVASATPHPPRPVLLIHGVVCNRGVWRPLARVLRNHNFGPVRAVNLEPLSADIDRHAVQVADQLRQLRRECHGARVAIVAHSMGGLVARAALRLTDPDDIDRIVTLASPHHGSWLAHALQWRPYLQMRPDSQWLAALNAAQEEHFPVPVSSIYSIDDNLVMPATSAILAGAQLCELQGLGHMSQLSAPAAIACTLQALSGPACRHQPCPT